MELNLIEYLESKNFEIEEIAKLEEKYIKDDAFGNIKKYESRKSYFQFLYFDVGDAEFWIFLGRYR